MTSLMRCICSSALLYLAWLFQLGNVSISSAQERLPNPFEPLDRPSTEQVLTPDSTESGLPPRQLPPSNQDVDQGPVERTAEDTKGPETKDKDDRPKEIPQLVPGPEFPNRQPGIPGDQRDDLVPPMFVPRDVDESELTVLPNRPELRGGNFTKPYIIDVNLGIDGLFQWYLTSSLDTAKNAGADLVIIRLTTLGGELHTSLELASKLLEIDWAKVVVWIPDEAISGGAIVSMGADAIYMKPSATIGDVGIIHLTLWGAGVLAEEKEVSYYASVMRQLAIRSGRHPEVVAAMMDRKLKVFQATEKASGKKVYLNERQSQNPAILAQVNLGQQLDETGNDRFLTVSGKRAVQLDLCEATFDTEHEMLKQLSSVEPIQIQLNWRQKLAYNLSGAWISGLIIVVGLVCLYIEFTVPGVVLPGLVSMCCFATFFWSHFLTGTAGGLEIMMFLLGAACLLIEIFLLPGFGVFGVAGLGLIGLSLLLATQDFLIPQSSEQWKQLERNGLSLVIAGIFVVGLIFFQLFWLDSIPGLAKLQLDPEPMPAATVAAEFDHPASKLSLGMQGVAHSDLRPSGKVLFEGQNIDVVSDGDYVERGSTVHIVRIEGNIVTVRKS